LAQQLGTHIADAQPQGAVEVQKSGKPKAKSKPPAKPKKESKEKDKSEPSAILSTFNRAGVMRIIQQVGYLMRGQDKIMDSVLGLQDEDSLKKGDGVRQGRFVLMTDKLFDMADRAPHDHCSFVLAVVLFHIIIRGLMMRLLYHRAAIALQKRYRYLKQKAKSRNSVAPAICIQRFWRGLRAGLKLARQEMAVEKIQHSYRAFKWNNRSSRMIKATLNMQRVWQGAVARMWIRTLKASATDIQRFARGMLVRVVLDRFGRDRLRQSQKELTAVMQKKNQLPESEYWAKCIAISGRARVALAKHRERNVTVRRDGASTLKSKHARQLDKSKKIKLKGSLQPLRLSIFEPFPSALRRIQRQQAQAEQQEQKGGAQRYGAPRSGVLQELKKCHKRLHRTMPSEEYKDPRVITRTHPAAKRGQAAMMARRLTKKVEATALKHNIVQDNELELWMQKQFQVKKR